MAVASKILLEDTLRNKDRKFGEDPFYYACFVQTGKDKFEPALFTEGAVKDALLRAKNNAEDIKPTDMKKKSLWEKMFG